MRFLKADRIFDGKHFLANGSILVLDSQNLLKDIIRETDAGEGKIETLEGILTPGFVNAHCHLELSHLKNRVPQNTGLPEFARQIITTRNNFTGIIDEAMQEADREMWEKGIVAVGDISNTSDSFNRKVQSKINYFTFIEVLGLNPASKDPAFKRGVELLEELKKKGLTGSLSPHAPYSTSNELIDAVSAFDRSKDLTLSIHNQESEEENQFFKNGSGKFNDLYRFLNLDISFFKPTGTSSLQDYADLLKGTRSIFVHNTFSSKDDIAKVSGSDTYWCFCPGANLYIENRLPDYTLFAEQSSAICVGTDSLASNIQLDLIREINLISAHTKTFTHEQLLRAVTHNGARALKLSEDYGGLIKGKNAGLNLISSKNNQFEFIKKIC